MSKRTFATKSDPQSTDNEKLRRRAKELHAELFAEEYDYMSDSISEANDRRRGKNPMSFEYTTMVNARRAELGIAPYEAGSAVRNTDTLSWVMDKLRAGEEVNLKTIIEERKRKSVNDKISRESERELTRTPAWKDKKIDEVLASDAFLSRGANRDDPDVIEFRILGAIFDINPHGSDKPGFHTQIRRVLPDKTDAEYDALFDKAVSEWMEAYGY